MSCFTRIVLFSWHKVVTRAVKTWCLLKYILSRIVRLVQYVPSGSTCFKLYNTTRTIWCTDPAWIPHAREVWVHGRTVHSVASLDREVQCFGMDEMQARTFLVFSQCVALRPPIHSDSIRLYPVDIRPKVERRLVWAWLCYCCCCLGWKWHGFWPIWHLVNLLTLFCMVLFWMAQSPVDPWCKK